MDHPIFEAAGVPAFEAGLFCRLDGGADAAVASLRSAPGEAHAVRRESMSEAIIAAADRPMPRGGAPAAGRRPAHDEAGPSASAGGRLRIGPELTPDRRPLVDSSSARSSFASLSGAMAVVADIRRTGVAVLRVELLDAPLAAVATRRGALPLEARPTLFFEFDGEAEAVEEATDTVEALLEAHGGDALHWASNPVAAAWLWKVRRNALAWTLASACAERPGVLSRSIEVRVQIPHLPEVVGRTRADAERAGIAAYILGDVGGGKVQCVFAHGPGEEAIVETLSERLARRVIAAKRMAGEEQRAGRTSGPFLRPHAAVARPTQAPPIPGIDDVTHAEHA